MNALRGAAAIIVGTVLSAAVGMLAGFVILGAMLALPFVLAYSFIRTLPESMRR